jgi:Zn-dependent peptidase ImmA (M78 family)
VSLRTEAYYRTIATDALARLGPGEPPVPIDALVETLGIPIRAVNLPAFFTGATVYEDGLPVMIVNWARPEFERRRALAHMLGHVLLVLHGDGNTYPRAGGPHAEADLVANELMMPTAMVIDQARLWFNDHRYLSRLFGVEETEMVERMRELGLIKGPLGVVWDY